MYKQGGLWLSNNAFILLCLLYFKGIYILFIRSILEFAAPVWSGAVSVNKKLCKSLESVQRYVCRLIKPGADPEHTLVELGLDLLVDRRLNLCRKYGRRISKDPRFFEYFPRNNRAASRSFGKFKIPSCKTRRYGYSSFLHLMQIMNEENK